MTKQKIVSQSQGPIKDKWVKFTSSIFKAEHEAYHPISCPEISEQKSIYFTWTLKEKQS